MGKSPAFQFYAADFYMDTMGWTATEVGAYLRLLMHQWVNGPLPEGNRARARIAGMDDRNFKRLWETTISDKFVQLKSDQNGCGLRIPDCVYRNAYSQYAGMYINVRLEATRQEQAEYREKQKEYGKLGAEVKKDNAKKKEDFSEMNSKATLKNSTRVSQALQSSIQHIRDKGVSLNGGPEVFKTFFSLFPGKKTIQTFDDSPANNKQLARIFHFDGEITEKTALQLQYMNEHRAGIYMSVNETDGKGRKSENVKAVRALFVDLDGAPLALAMMYDPTLVVESSKDRFHCYWFTEDVPLGSFSVMQRTLADRFHGDQKVHDLPRVLRVPGFYHNKYDPFMTRVISGSGKIYAFSELVAMFPPINPKQDTPKPYKLIKTGNEEFRGVYGAANGERNNHVLKRVGGMIKRGCSWDYIESEALKEGLACDPPLSESEVLQILKSARRYA